MRYQSGTAFRTALEQRLLARSHATGLALSRLRKLVAFERLLARLLVVAPDRWVLKGGLALDFRLGDQARATIDMDLGRHDDDTAANHDFIAARLTDLGDYFAFTIDQTPILDEADVAGAVRYRARASLAGRRFEDFIVDVGFSEPLAEPDEVIGPDLLAFADLPPIRVPTLPLPTHVAEKVHAYTKRYGPSQLPSMRVKDLVDLVLIAALRSFSAGELRVALDRTFTSRTTHPLPQALPEPPTAWAEPYRRMAQTLSIAVDLRDAYQATATFLDPLQRFSIPFSVAASTTAPNGSRRRQPGGRCWVMGHR
jgi:hypothetical protein